VTGKPIHASRFRRRVTFRTRDSPYNMLYILSHIVRSASRRGICNAIIVQGGHARIWFLGQWRFAFYIMCRPLYSEFDQQMSCLTRRSQYISNDIRQTVLFARVETHHKSSYSRPTYSQLFPGADRSATYGGALFGREAGPACTPRITPARIVKSAVPTPGDTSPMRLTKL